VSTTLLMVCDDRAEFELCQTLLASTDLGLELVRVDGAVPLAEAVSAGPYRAIIVDIALRFAPSAEVAGLLLRSLDAPLIALGGGLVGATWQLSRGAAGYLELPVLLRRMLHEPAGSGPTSAAISRMADLMGLGHALIGPDDTLIHSNATLKTLITGSDDSTLAQELLADTVTWQDDVGAVPGVHIDGQSVRVALVRAGSERHCLVAPAEPMVRDDSPHLQPGDVYRPLQDINRYADQLSISLESTSDPRLRELVANLIDATARANALVGSVKSRPLATPETGDVRTALTAATGELEPLLRQTKVTVKTGDLPTVGMGVSSLTALFKGLLQHTIAHRASPSVNVSVSAKRREGDWLLRLQTPDAQVPVLGDPPPARMIADDAVSDIFVCRSIVERHGGRLWIEPGDAGSELLFTVPERQDAPSTSPTPTKIQGSARPSWGKSAVVIHTTESGAASVTTAEDAVSAAAAASRDEASETASRLRGYDITQALTNDTPPTPQGAETTEVWDERLASDEDNESWGHVLERFEGTPGSEAPSKGDSLEADWAAIVDGLAPKKSQP
jgi:hypothetical protein